MLGTLELLDDDRSQLEAADGAELTFVAMLGAFLDGRAVDHPPLERLQGEYARALG